MRDDVIESVLIGCTVGVFAVALHAWVDAAAPAIQVFALVSAGLILAVLQLVIARRRRIARRADDALIEPLPPPAPPRNQFLRELTSDWVGLDDTSPTRSSVPAPNGLPEPPAEATPAADAASPPDR